MTKSKHSSIGPFPVGASADMIFGPYASILGNMLNLILPDLLTLTYTFMAEEEYGNLVRVDIAKAKKIYWYEILERAHWVSSVTLIRTARWVASLVSEYEAKNFLGWAASCRALLESAGDSADSLLDIALIISEDHRTISEHLTGKSSSLKFLFAGEVEDALIHFTHARRYSRKAAVPEAHRAKQTKSYIDRLEKHVPKSSRLYEILCEVVHPAAATVALMGVSSPDGGSVRMCANYDSKALHEFVNEYKEALDGVLHIALNPAFAMLHVIQHFNVLPRISEIDRFDLSGLGVGRKIMAALNK